MNRVSVFRCPKCGSTDAGPDEARSRYDFTWMQCRGCGDGGLVDSWQRDMDWRLEIEMPEGSTTIPARVAPLPAGDGLFETPAASAATTPRPERRFGCERCFGADAETAWHASRQQPVQSLVDESHFDVRVAACACGQRFASVFTERIDWAGGNDDQTSLVLPIDAAEFQQLATCSEGDLEHLLTGFGHGRRFLLRAYPTAGPLTTQWRDRGFAIGPHD